MATAVLPSTESLGTFTVNIIQSGEEPSLKLKSKTDHKTCIIKARLSPDIKCSCPAVTLTS